MITGFDLIWCFPAKEYCRFLDASYRVLTHFSRSNSSTFQALLRVIFKLFQHLIAGVKYISTGIYILSCLFIFSLFITMMYIVLCCKHLKLCFMTAKSLEIKGDKVLSKEKGKPLTYFREILLYIHWTFIAQVHIQICTNSNFVYSFTLFDTGAQICFAPNILQQLQQKCERVSFFICDLLNRMCASVIKNLWMCKFCVVFVERKKSTSTQLRVCEHTFTDTHTQSLYTTTNSTVTGAFEPCESITECSRVLQ